MFELEHAVVCDLCYQAKLRQDIDHRYQAKQAQDSTVQAIYLELDQGAEDAQYKFCAKIPRYSQTLPLCIWISEVRTCCVGPK